MKSFIAKYLFLIIWIGAIAVIGGLFIYVFQVNSHLAPLTVPSPLPSPANALPPPPPAPNIGLTLGTLRGKSTLTISWENLPGDTVALNIFRGKTGTGSSTWQLWKTVNIPSGMTTGNLQINSGSNAGYSFYIQAVSGNGGNSSSTSGGGGGNVLWTSDVTVPGAPAPSSTTQAPPQSSSTNTGGPGNSSGTAQNPPPPPPAPPTPTPPPATPTGTPYYNPQVQISSYGSAQDNNFWVQHVDQKIQIGWQNLPADTDSIAIYRSPNQDGPWTTVLTQENSGTNGSYSIQIVDNTLGSPYYYEMNAQNGSTTIATYGPVYLAPQ